MKTKIVIFLALFLCFLPTVSAWAADPVADAGPDQTVLVGDTVQLDGSGSNDPDPLDTLTFAWSFVSVPAGSTATLSDPTAVNPTFVVDVSGNYVVQLIVNEGTVDSLPDSVSISTDNSPPVADAGPDQTPFEIGRASCRERVLACV